MLTCSPSQWPPAFLSEQASLEVKAVFNDLDTLIVLAMGVVPKQTKEERS